MFKIAGYSAAIGFFELQHYDMLISTANAAVADFTEVSSAI